MNTYYKKMKILYIVCFIYKIIFTVAILAQAQISLVYATENALSACLDRGQVNLC